MISISDPIIIDGGGLLQQPSILAISSTVEPSALSVAQAPLITQRHHIRCSEKLGRADASSRRDSIYSLRTRELHCERELKRLHSHLNEAEDQLIRMEFEIQESKCKIDSLTEEVTIKKQRIKQLENSEKLYIRTQEEMETRLSMMNKQIEQMQRHHEIQKEKLLEYKGSEEKWEARLATLEEGLEAKNNAIQLLERKLRDVDDELLHSCELLKNRENDRTRLRREVEELRRNAEVERDEYKASIADWRNRLEKTIAENLAACAADMDRNAYIAREMREKTEEVEKLQKLLEREKERVQNFGGEIARFRDNMKAVTLKLVDLESKLIMSYKLQRVADTSNLRRSHTIREQLAVNKHRNHMDTNKLKNGVLTSERITAEDRMNLQTLYRGGTQLETKCDEIYGKLQRKEEALKEAMLTMECLRDGIFTSAEKLAIHIPMIENSKDNGFELCEELREIVNTVKWYTMQFEDLERRLAIDNLAGRPTSGSKEYVYTSSKNELLADEVLSVQGSENQSAEQCGQQVWDENLDITQKVVEMNNKGNSCSHEMEYSSGEASIAQEEVQCCSIDSPLKSLPSEVIEDDLTQYDLKSTTNVFSPQDDLVSNKNYEMIENNEGHISGNTKSKADSVNMRSREEFSVGGRHSYGTASARKFLKRTSFYKVRKSLPQFNCMI